jgi:tetratricopeptide (TPR) repeat protein
MAEENVSGARRKARADLIEQIDAAEDPERALLEYLIARVEKKDAELTKIIRYCAIPRRFDATVIGVLRQAPDESETNEGLLDRLLRFSFVRSRPDSGYAYDDSTRDILLEAWRDAEKRKEFDDLNARLVEFYEDQYEEAQRLERDLEQVAGLVRDACEERYVQLVSALERRILAPLLEAIYHGTLRSASSGYNQFARYFESWEAKDRLTICRSLLNATRTYFERLLPSSDQEPCLKWMDYWEARLQGGLRNHSEAEEILRKLLPQAEDDAKLKLWVWGSFAQTLHQRSKLREAREEYEGLLAFVETTHEDPYNLPWRHGGLANLYWSLGELSRAAEKYREAIRYAQEQRNFPMEAYTRLSLSGVLYEEGKWEEGIEAALQAFDFVRTECSTDRNLHFAVASRFMALLARRAPRLLDTIFVEATELLSGLAAPLRQLQLHNQYVNSLQDSGQLRRAEEALTDLKARASSSSDTAFAADLLLREGLLREGQGRLDEAIAVYTQLLQGSGKSQEIDWTYLAALSNRGMKWESLSRWPDAESDLREALAGWDKIGHRNLAAVMRVCLAEAARRQGQLAKSQELLDEALPSLIGLAPARLADYYEAQGDLFRTQAKRSEATTQYQQALAIRRSLDHFKDSAQILGRLAELAATLGQWERAEQYTAEANRLWQRLATVNRCQYTELAKQSDKENADGLCCFSEAGEDRREKLNQACNLFRSASEKVPDNFWYLLNLSYACAELEEWAEAAQAVEAILDRGPEWICSGSFLYERLIDYRLKHGALLIKAGRYEDAAQIYANSRARVESHVPLDELAGAWLKLGDYLLKLGLFKQARGEYLAVLACTTQIASAAVRADLHGRLGFLATVQVDARRSLSDSGTNFTKAIELYRAGDVSNPGEALGEACSTLLQSVGDYWTLESRNR